MLHTFVGPSLDEIFLPDDIKQIGLLQGSLMHLLGLDVFVQVGHPHYTTEPDRKSKLFFASFRDTFSNRTGTGKEGYTHEIWVVEVNTSIFDPRSYSELKGKFKGEESKWHYVSNAKKLIISLNSETELHLKLDIKDEMNKVIKLSKGINVIDKPTTWIRLISPSEITATIKALF